MRYKILLLFCFCLLLYGRLYAQCVDAQTAQRIIQPAVPDEECLAAWQNYRKADVLWKTGWGLFGIGMSLCLGGGILWATTMQGYLPPDKRDFGKETVSNVGFYTMIAGAGITLASVPCLAVGQVRRKASMQQFYEQCPQQQPLLTFSVQTSSNGLGVAMNF